MTQVRYQLKTESTRTVFEFVSKGPKGEIVKIVQYSNTDFNNIYNLSFGDKDIATGNIYDQTITNNGDSQKVLATVAATVYIFLHQHPDAWIYATGSNITRTRLYRMGISNNLAEIQNDFEIFGLKDKQWEEFKKNTNYEAFLLRRKI